MATTTVSGTDPLAAGRAALERAAWDEARAIFEEATADGGTAEAWDGLSRAAWWQGDEEATLAARERAYRAYRDAGDPRRAARMAMWLGSDHLDFRGDHALAEAWLRRGRELVDGLEPCAEQAWLMMYESDIALLVKRDLAAARAGAEEALALARRVEDAGVEAVALAVLGNALIGLGAAEEGLRRLEQSVSVALGEDFDETAAPGWAFCHTVSACADVGDFDRAAQWCGALHSWSATWRARQFFGICRTAYGDVLATRGDWSEAEQELVSAMEDLGATRPALAAAPTIRLGELARTAGRPGRGAQAVRVGAADAAGHPGDRGARPRGAATPRRRRMQPTACCAGSGKRRRACSTVCPRSSCSPAPARPPADAPGAVAAAEDVEREAARLATPYMRGRSALVRAEVLAAAGDHDGARRAAEDAVDLFAASSAPYEAARARMLLARALEALGRTERAEAEAAAAREAFRLLGAGGQDGGGPTGDLTVREVEILRLVAQGLSDAEIAEPPLREPAHGASPRGERPHEAPGALARRRRRSRHARRPALARSWPVPAIRHRWPVSAKKPRLRGGRLAA